MSKAIAVHAVFIVAVISITIFFVMAIFFQWIDTTKFTSNAATCTAKKISYCAEWARTGNQPGSGFWEDKDPKDCESGGIAKPTCQDCKESTRSDKIKC